MDLPLNVKITHRDGQCAGSERVRHTQMERAEGADMSGGEW